MFDEWSRKRLLRFQTFTFQTTFTFPNIYVFKRLLRFQTTFLISFRNNTGSWDHFVKNWENSEILTPSLQTRETSTHFLSQNAFWIPYCFNVQVIGSSIPHNSSWIEQTLELTCQKTCFFRFLGFGVLLMPIPIKQCCYVFKNAYCIPELTIGEFSRPSYGGQVGQICTKRSENAWSWRYI